MFASLFKRSSGPAPAPRRAPGNAQPAVKKFKNAQAAAAARRAGGRWGDKGRGGDAAGEAEERDPPSAKGKNKGKKQGAAAAAQPSAQSAKRPAPGADAGDGATAGLNRLERKRLRRKERKREAKELARSQKAAQGQEGAGKAAPPAARGDGASQDRKKTKRKKGKGQDAAAAPAPVEAPQKRRKGEAPQAPAAAAAPRLLSAAASCGSSLGRAAARLQGSRFRWLNETLYSTTGAEAKDLFEQDPTLAQVYHEGFTVQRAKWPRDPLLDVIEWIRKEVPASSVIGDFGCGEARVAAALPKRTVHSFDLVRVNERVTPCNLADVPLKDGTLDVVIFCLALMGTDWLKFMQEAHRCLKPGGLCHIVEVESRFEDFGAVVARIQGLGFRLVLDRPGSFFVEFRFEKLSAPGAGAGAAGKRTKKKGGKDVTGSGLGACTYRKR